MERLLNDEVSNQIKEFLNQMVNPIKMVLFTDKGLCNTCKETRQLLNEITPLNDKITLIEKDMNEDKEDAEKYGITMTPSFVMLNENDEYLGVKFNGIPAGHEINSFLSAILHMSGVDLGLDEATIKKIKAIDKKVDIKVFVTLSCPHCPGAVETAHRLAMLNENIESSMIEAQTFHEMSNKYNVSGVPKIVINDKHELVGNQPIEAFLKELSNL
ncbi:MAG: protein disulfide oxidoreductase [Candidatus Izemoplasmataceae bacterium]